MIGSDNDRTPAARLRPGATRPLVVAFDVNETLFSLAPVGARLEAHGLPQQALGWWFARTLRDGAMLAAMGRGAPFRELAVDALADVLLAYGLNPLPGTIDEVIGAMAEMEPHPDAEPAIRALAAGGVRLVTLTNGAASLTDALLRRCGLRHHFDACLSVDDVGVWKPRPEPYLHAAAVAGVQPHQAALVAVHSWDTAGAAAARLTTGWASRLEGRYPPRLGSPDVRGANLLEVAEGLLALPEGARG